MVPYSFVPLSGFPLQLALQYHVCLLACSRPLRVDEFDVAGNSFLKHWVKGPPRR
ncbi:hypothetical protein BR93DRAFT_925322 [Coniochaeta sp. PMI_546]|nr:hypothetical protein BR93DRAFT_925322 [Coniochaeta sp. PMI_546]